MLKKLLVLVALLGAFSTPAGAVTPSTKMFDANLAVPGDAYFVITQQVFSAPRTLTLPYAGATAIGQTGAPSYYQTSLTFTDYIGAVSPTNTLTIVPQPGNTINGSSSPVVLNYARPYFIAWPLSGNDWYMAIGTTGLPPTPANPTAQVGLTAINGSAITYMRSDAAPALNQAITPTWTGAHNFPTPSNFGTPAAIVLTNGTGLPIATGVSGLGTGCATWLGTPSSANLRGCLTDESGTGLAYFQGGALGTPASGDATNLTNVNVGSPIGTLPVANGGTGQTTIAGQQGALSLGMLGFKLASANFNSTADQAIAITLPTGFTRYQVNAIIVSNPSVSLTTAAGGFYTATSKGGSAIVPASQTYASLTNNTPGTSGSLLSLGVTNTGTAFYNSATIYFSLTTGQGTAATADVTVFIRPLP